MMSAPSVTATATAIAERPRRSKGATRPSETLTPLVADDRHRRDGWDEPG